MQSVSSRIWTRVAVSISWTITITPRTLIDNNISIRTMKRWRQQENSQTIESEVKPNEKMHIEL